MEKVSALRGSRAHREPGRPEVVLIYPPWTVLQERGYLMNCLPPLGILSIAAYLREQGIGVQVIDVHAERLSPGGLRDRLRRLSPRYVGITVLSPMETAALAIARMAKEELPQTVVVMGGVHAESFPARLLRSSRVDLVVRGDGERPMTMIASGMPWEKIPSVSFREQGGSIRHNEVQSLERDLDAYPMPAYDLVDMDCYSPSATSYKNLPALNVMMTRGCPGACTFCNSARTALRSHSPRRVLEVIRLLKKRHGIRQVQFFDDTFTADRKRVLELCRLIQKSNTRITFSCYARGDTFNEELAAALARAGCHQIMLGIETGSEKIMRSIGKVIHQERHAEIVRLAHGREMEVRGGFIIGSLGETRETMEESLRLAIDLDLDFFQPSISTPYPGTMLFRRAIAEDRIEHFDLHRYGQGEAIVRLDDLTKDEIAAFERYAFRRFYLRPSMLTRQLRRVTGRHHLADLFNAFRLLILRGSIEKDRALSEWEEEMQPEIASAAVDPESFLEGVDESGEAVAPLTYLARRPAPKSNRV